MRENKNVYTKELQNVLSYMYDVLANEFPTDVFTPEYLMISILDNKNSHANRILDNCLMSNNMDELKEIYVNFLNSHSKPLLNENGTKNISKELNTILSNAMKEMNKTNSNSVGTEHVLLSILDESNESLLKDVLNSMGVEYGFIFNKCSENNNNLPVKVGGNNKPVKFINNNGGVKPSSLPIKSEVNAKAVFSKSEYIDKYTVNINKLVREGKVDELVGREKEMKQIIKTLARRKKNNVVLVGKGGVGKTAIVKNLALMIEREEVPAMLRGKEIVMIDFISIVSGTHFRGMFEERVKGLFDEFKSSDKYIMLIDDVHTVLRSGSKDKDTDISGMISDVLSEGDVKVICTTSFKEYRNTIESNSAISRKLQKIVIEPSSVKESVEILMKSKKYYEDFHNVIYTEKAIESAVNLADRYITDRSLPDSAFDIIDMAGAQTCFSKEPDTISNLRKRLKEIDAEETESLNRGEFEVIDALDIERRGIKKMLADYSRDNKNECSVEITEDDIAATVSEVTNIPIKRLSTNEKKKIAHIDDVLKKSVIGQDEAIDAICRVIKRNKVGLGDKSKVCGVALLCGPTGVGKSLISKKLAEEIFGDANALIRIDMSEYSEKNSVAKLMGAAPGYIGYENGGQLTEQVKNKQHCVLLLDEIEKADQEVYNLFLQLFDEGRLTDSSGQLVNFKNVIVLMTSNVGSKKAAELGNGVGFVANEGENRKAIIEKELKHTFSPEFLNRIDNIVYFNDLTDDDLKKIAVIEIDNLNKRINEIGYSIEYDESVVDYVYRESVKERDFGARPIKRIIQRNIEDKLTDMILEKDYETNHVFKVTCSENKIEIE